MRDRLIGFVAALAVVASGALLGIFLGALFGVASPPGPDRLALVAFVVVVAFLLPTPEMRRGSEGAVAGVVLGVAAVIVLELVKGPFVFGAGQVGAMVGALVAIPFLRLAWEQRVAWETVARAGLVILVVIAGLGLLRVVIDGGALGHDESAYAVKARFWLIGTPDTGWAQHRALALSVLGMPLVAVSEAEWLLRSLSVVFSLGALVAVGLVASRLAGTWGAVIGMGVVASSLSYLRRGSEFLTDIPAAGLLLLIVWLILTVLSDDTRDGRLLLWLGPLIAAAFYMRYQSALAVVGISLGALWAWPRRVRDLAGPLTKTAIVLFVALIPHFVWATLAFGSPWAVVLDTSEAGGRQFLGEGLVDYIEFAPVDLAGPLGALMMLAGLGWLIWTLGVSLLRRAKDEDARLSRFVLLAVFVSVVPLGLVSHGEPRFVFFPVWLLVCVGAMVGVRVAQRLPGRWALVLSLVALALWLPLFAETVRRADRNAEARGQTFQVVADASNLIEQDSGGSCGVLTTYEPQVNWYSTCSTASFQPNSPDLGVRRLGGESHYVLLFENGKREPQGEARQAYLELGSAVVVRSANDRIGDATIFGVE